MSARFIKLEHLRIAATFASEDETRRAITGVSVEFTPGETIYRATNGRIAIRIKARPHRESEECIPAKATVPRGLIALATVDSPVVRLTLGATVALCLGYLSPCEVSLSAHPVDAVFPPALDSIVDGPEGWDQSAEWLDCDFCGRALDVIRELRGEAYNAVQVSRANGCYYFRTQPGKVEVAIAVMGMTAGGKP